MIVSKESSHFDHIFFNTQFLLCISFTLKDCMSRIGNMWLCFVVHVVGTYDFDHPGNIRYLIYFLAMLVDGDWIVIHMEVLRVINLG